MRSWMAGLVVLAALCASSRAEAQYFRNQGLQLPNAGWLGLSTWDHLLNGGHAATDIDDDGWNIWDQPTLGAGYFFAIGYNLWLDSQAAIGASTTTVSSSAAAEPVLTLAISSGLRYNFMEERHRPYVAAHIQYLQLIALTNGTAEIPGNEFLGNTPFFIGFRPGVGYEYIFGDEMSVQAELGIIGFVVPDGQRGIGSLFLPASVARVSYNIYF